MAKKKSKEFEENMGRLNKRTTDELREITRRGGKRSGEVRREKKTFLECVRLLQHETFQTKKGEELEYSEATAMRLWNKAINGDLNAMKLIGQLLGDTEKAGNNVQIVFADSTIGKTIMNI